MCEFTSWKCSYLQLAGERCSKSFVEAKGDREKELKLMLDWAFKGFLPTGPEGFLPPGKCTCRSLYLFTESLGGFRLVQTVSLCTSGCVSHVSPVFFLSLSQKMFAEA